MNQGYIKRERIRKEEINDAYLAYLEWNEVTWSL